jgi:hypothetical protein
VKRAAAIQADIDVLENKARAVDAKANEGDWKLPYARAGLREMTATGPGRPRESQTMSTSLASTHYGRLAAVASVLGQRRRLVRKLSPRG